MKRDAKEFINQPYKEGFETVVETEEFPIGLDENIIKRISSTKNEPHWLLEMRLKAYNKWLAMDEPSWANLSYPKIDYQKIRYYSAPKNISSLDEVDAEILKTYERLGIPLEEQKVLAGMAVDAVFDSVSVKTTFSKTLEDLGIIFCSFSEAVKRHPELIKKYLFSVVAMGDNYFAALNAAVFSDGTFVYIPSGVRCPMELSSYFRINAMNTGQFERTLIIADDDSFVSYNEGCSAPMRDENQLHAAVVELVAHKSARINYATLQNWYPGDAKGVGGIYNFVTKRGKCAGEGSHISWTQVETGSAITWKYPSCILLGDNSSGEFYSVAITSLAQQADTGTKMFHIGRNTKSTIISKGISAMSGSNSYRGEVRVAKNADNAHNYTSCDSLLLGDECSAHTFPYINVKNSNSTVEHEASATKIAQEQLFYLMQRGLSEEQSIALIVNGFCSDVLERLPMEFAVEARELLALTMEGAVG